MKFPGRLKLFYRSPPVDLDRNAHEAELVRAQACLAHWTREVNRLQAKDPERNKAVLK